MVFFRDSKTKKLSLVVLDKEEDSDTEGTVLPINVALYDSCSKSCDKMPVPDNLSEWSSPSHRDSGDYDAITLHSSHKRQDKLRFEPYQLLGRKILAGGPQWDKTFRIPGEFSFTAGYWEWLEIVLSRNKNILESIGLYDAVFASLFLYDRNAEVTRAFLESWCPSTNTLHTATGEISISLWDLRKIGGLPVVGMFYDEVIPCTDEILATLPRSCAFLFGSYRRIKCKERKVSKVSFSDWIQFWYDGPKVYHHVSKNKPSTRDPVYPNGKMEPPREWSAIVESTFSLLGVPEALKEETYLAAFFSYWLCAFVLPRGTSIRPETFKMASLMASGRVVSLAVPVLSLIYRGLREFSTASCPGKCKAYFPAHYVYAWLGRYFRTHHSNCLDQGRPYMVRISGNTSAISYTDIGARELFRSKKQILWHCNTYSFKERRKIHDNSQLSTNELTYFMSIRSSYLVYRQDSIYIVEPYSPDRFSRQFGFCQDISYDLGKAPWEGSLEDLHHFY